MLGIGLLFVGITLICNGLGGLLGIHQKSLAVMNLFTGTLSFLCNMIYVIRGDYYEAGTGFLFAFTYLLVGVLYIYNLDMRIYGIFALFVAINTIPCAYISWQIDGDPLFAIIWLLWGLLWATGFIEYVLHIHIGKPVLYFALFCGVFTTWIPGFLMLTNLWPYG
ncbi:hypothetical protein RV11_GL000490 [Enterococcus phoeniculicola]|uniref:Acid-activated urea channel n=1 Tax=Enterococcus phoeniculicola ATCC BAA-412 TaxID=1158610 RepID=R3WEA5_9ENTE|nr:AmiS/UreI family transporter [Enterococcus phoeniculicola]EOL46206.1 hypothetical protein UC3_01012 [Enterococcus phoeniculicola ATCC BAA-412]EOT76949.1 hypothetical protein I589_01910 [Enterococcus phoeniculicola ATCC BAA-412]OJG71200.1 hypothetical protein RV11_GL000490 [Enterococcus phoeniculicola]